MFSAKGGRYETQVLFAERAWYFVQIPLEKFPPGRYWLQLNVLDPARDRVAFARVPPAVVNAL